MQAKKDSFSWNDNTLREISVRRQYNGQDKTTVIEYFHTPFPALSLPLQASSDVMVCSQWVDSGVISLDTCTYNNFKSNFLHAFCSRTNLWAEAGFQDNSSCMGDLFQHYVFMLIVVHANNSQMHCKCIILQGTYAFSHSPYIQTSKQANKQTT